MSHVTGAFLLGTVRIIFVDQSRGRGYGRGDSLWLVLVTLRHRFLMDKRVRYAMNLMMTVRQAVPVRRRTIRVIKQVSQGALYCRASCPCATPRSLMATHHFSITITSNSTLRGPLNRLLSLQFQRTPVLIRLDARLLRYPILLSMISI